MPKENPMWMHEPEIKDALINGEPFKSWQNEEGSFSVSTDLGSTKVIVAVGDTEEEASATVDALNILRAALHTEKSAKEAAVREAKQWSSECDTLKAIVADIGKIVGWDNDWDMAPAVRDLIGLKNEEVAVAMERKVQAERAADVREAVSMKLSTQLRSYSLVVENVVFSLRSAVVKALDSNQMHVPLEPVVDAINKLKEKPDAPAYSGDCRSVRPY